MMWTAVLNATIAHADNLCPATHPWAYELGNKCCAYAKPEIMENSTGPACGAELSFHDFNHQCGCRDDKFIECKQPPCYKNQKAAEVNNEYGIGTVFKSSYFKRRGHTGGSTKYNAESNCEDLGLVLYTPTLEELTVLKEDFIANRDSVSSSYVRLGCFVGLKNTCNTINGLNCGEGGDQAFEDSWVDVSGEPWSRAQLETLKFDYKKIEKTDWRTTNRDMSAFVFSHGSKDEFKDYEKKGEKRNGAICSICSVKPYSTKDGVVPAPPKVHTCPASHPWAYESGKKCCATGEQKEFISEKCDGGALREQDHCGCKDDQFVECEAGANCVTNEEYAVSLCPASHPFPYDSGKSCCGFNKQNFTLEGVCHGGELSFHDECGCLGDRTHKCVNPPCLLNASAQANNVFGVTWEVPKFEDDVIKRVTPDEFWKVCYDKGLYPWYPTIESEHLYNEKLSKIHDAGRRGSAEALIGIRRKASVSKAQLTEANKFKNYVVPGDESIEFPEKVVEESPWMRHYYSIGHDKGKHDPEYDQPRASSYYKNIWAEYYSFEQPSKKEFPWDEVPAVFKFENSSAYKETRPTSRKRPLIALCAQVPYHGYELPKAGSHAGVNQLAFDIVVEDDVVETHSAQAADNLQSN